MKTGKCEGRSNLTEPPSLLKTVYYSFGNIKRSQKRTKEGKYVGYKPVFTDLASFEDILSVFEIFTLSFHTGNRGRKGNHIHTVPSSIIGNNVFSRS